MAEKRACLKESVLSGSLTRSDVLKEEAFLIARLARRDRQAINQIIHHYLADVTRLACYILGDENEAEDISQQVFIKLWKKIPDWYSETQSDSLQHKNRARLSTWLYKVTVNLCIDVKRRKSWTELKDVLKGPIFKNIQDPSLGPTEMLEKEQAKHEVNKALQSLNIRYRLALVLKYYQGLSQKEAANIMKVNVRAFESLLSRARKAMKKKLNLSDKGKAEI